MALEWMKILCLPGGGQLFRDYCSTSEIELVGSKLARETSCMVVCISHDKKPWPISHVGSLISKFENSQTLGHVELRIGEYDETALKFVQNKIETGFARRLRRDAVWILTQVDLGGNIVATNVHQDLEINGGGGL